MRLLAALLPLLATAYTDPRCEAKLHNCTLSDLDTLCTCDGKIDVQREVRPVVLYITPLVDDDGRVFLYDRTLEFASVFMKNMVGGWKEWLHVFLVHHGNNYLKFQIKLTLQLTRKRPPVVTWHLNHRALLAMSTSVMKLLMDIM